MGLDNGIMCKLKNKPPKFLHFYHFKSEDEYEILYWRKYWGVRREILKILNGYDSTNIGCNDGIFNISYDQMKTIFHLCVKLCNKKFFDEYAGSHVFNYEDSKKIMRWNVLRAGWLLMKMKFDKSIKPYFYDSY